MERLHLEREAVEEAIATLVSGARMGQGSTLFILGEAGLGKTTALDCAVEAAGEDVRIGRAAGEMMESALPFGLALEALTELAGDAGRQALGPTRPSEAPRARASRFYAALELIERVGAPALLALDDLHAADPDSLALVSFLCRRAPRLRLAIAATLRPWPPAAAELAEALADAGDARLERLAPLSASAAHRLLTARAGPLGRALADRAWRLCGGNPLLLEEAGRALARGDRLPDERVAVSGRLLLNRFGGLGKSVLRCAQAAAVLGTRFRPDIAVEAALLEDADGDEALEALIRSGLLRELEDGWAEFVHALFRDALYEDLPRVRQARLHRRAFTALARRGLEAEAAEHAVPAGLVGDEQAIALVERAGRRALASGAPARAAERLDAAARLAGDSAAPSLLAALGESLFLAGRPGEAVVTLERALRADGLEETTRIAVLRTLARALAEAGEYVGAAARFDEAAALAEATAPGEAVRMLLSRAAMTWLVAGPVHGRPFSERALTLASGGDDGVAREADVTAGFLSLLTGDAGMLGRAAAAAETIAAGLTVDRPDLASQLDVLGIYGRLATCSESFGEAERIFRLALRVAEEAPSHAGIPHLPQLLVGLAAALIPLGRLSEAEEVARRAAGLADLFPLVDPYAALKLGHILLLRGLVEDAEACCSRADRVATARGEAYPLLWSGTIRGRRLLGEGDARAAAEEFARVWALSEQMGVGEPCMVPWARHAAVAFAAASRLDEAASIVEWLERASERLPCRWPRIAAAAGRAAIADRRGDRAAADAAYELALDLHREVELPLEHVETLIAYGAFLRRSGRPSRARDALRGALARAEERGARWLADAASSELRLAGGRRRARDDPRRLTPAEERVARLAAAGRSNREIAAALFLSVRTVESHLRSVYAKRGIRSRRALTHVAPVRNGVTTAAEGERATLKDP